MIRLSSVTAKKGHFSLGPADLEINGGEIIAFMGDNGSGKSTLLNIIAGIEKPESGKIERTSSVAINGDFSQYQVFMSTVEKDIAFSLSKKERSTERIKNAMESVCLDYESMRKKSPFELSEGNFRKVSLAGAIIRRDDVLIMDESLSSFDAESRRKIFSWMLSYKENGKSLLFSTHDAERAVYADRIVFLKNGKIAFDGPSSSFFKEEVLSSFSLDMVTAMKMSANARKMGVDVDEYRIEDFIASFKRKRYGL